MSNKEDERTPNECAQILRAVADETRLQIIQLLFQKEKCGSDIAEELNLPQPHIAHHLGILKNAKLVDSQRQGQKVLYRLHPVFQKSVQENSAQTENSSQTLDIGCCKISFGNESE